MEQNKVTESATKLLKQFDDLKKKYPDALLLFRDNDVYRAFKVSQSESLNTQSFNDRC